MSKYNAIFNEISYFIVDNNKINKMIETTELIKQPEIVIKNRYFIPPQSDTLFWCFYIINNGIYNYEILNNKNFLISTQLKIDLIKIIRENKNIIKTYKFDSIVNIENNLANEQLLNTKVFLTLCAIKNINIILIKNNKNKNTYFELFMNDTNTIYIIREHEKKFSFELIQKELINDIVKNMYKIDNISKPIKSISSYKVEDLITICNKLSIEIINTETKKIKLKKELYDSILKQHIF